jgi:type II secretory pathway component PulF
MSPEELAALNDEIAGMARAGLPLDQGLAALAKEMGRGRLRQVTADLAADLKAGRTLPEALERQGGRLPPFYAGLIAAGIRTGRIGEVLATLTGYTRTLAQLRSTIRDALLYPAVVTTIGLVLFGALCFFVLPIFDQIFSEWRMRLPFLTEAALAFGRHPMELFVWPLVVLLAGVFALRLVLRTMEVGRSFWARMVYATPVLGTLLRASRLEAFTELLAVLIDHEVPLPEAFRLAGQACSDPLMTVSARDLSEDLANGIPLGEALRGRGLVPEWVAWMTGLGERRGSLGQTLHQTAPLPPRGRAAGNAAAERAAAPGDPRHGGCLRCFLHLRPDPAAAASPRAARRRPPRRSAHGALPPGAPADTAGTCTASSRRAASRRSGPPGRSCPNPWRSAWRTAF